MREGTTPLPTPLDSGAVSVETALARRRSVREFAERPLTAAEISQLLWAAQGVTSTDGRRTAPSAGALYPLEIYVATAEGVGHHLPAGHLLEPRLSGDLRSRLSRAALSQPSVSAAPAIFIITGVAERTRVKYGDRAERYIWLEAGHAAQNLLLQATALGLAGVPIGAFSDEALRRELNLPNGEMPLYLVPIGAPR
ncbi:MAG: SagB/ThcOx family dehydrogenase [Candidatus Eisenbacteria bacterium]|nr:SagB/ThcOx family dehydrogenase [Candidatus Eisenbacteria bacterium]